MLPRMDPDWGIVLAYDPKLRGRNVWSLNDAGDGIVFRASLGEIPTAEHAIRIRVFEPRSVDPDAHRAREVREGTWRISPVRVWPGLEPCWVFLRDCPPWVREMFRRL